MHVLFGDCACFDRKIMHMLEEELYACVGWELCMWWLWDSCNKHVLVGDYACVDWELCMFGRGLCMFGRALCMCWLGIVHGLVGIMHVLVGDHACVGWGLSWFPWGQENGVKTGIGQESP